MFCVSEFEIVRLRFEKRAERPIKGNERFKVSAAKVALFKAQEMPRFRYHMKRNIEKQCDSVLVFIELQVSIEVDSRKLRLETD
jgi:hypothetical protein